MAFWSFVQCRWCGFSGCAAPIGERCPNCGRLPEAEPTREPAPDGEPARP